VIYVQACAEKCFFYSQHMFPKTVFIGTNVILGCKSSLLY